MLCKSPYVRGNLAFGCRQCLPCRINLRRTWAFRMCLESVLHAASTFGTLTYADEFVPPGGTLAPRDATLFLKRIRKRLSPVRVRYFLCGEYGERTQRPHYHLVLFGIGPDVAPLAQECWPQGFVMFAPFSWATANYIAGYVTKKMTSVDDSRLNGRHPEFARMSTSPGLGAHAMRDVAATLNDAHGARLVAEAGDAPGVLRMGSRMLPLGRYLKRRLRDELGFDELGAQAKPLAALQAEMQQLLADSPFASTPAFARRWLEVAKPMVKTQRIRQLEARHAIFSQRKDKL